MDSGNIISKIILGRGIEKFKIFTTVYVFTMSVFITNYIVNGMGYFYNGTVEIEYNSAINFLLSPIGILITIIFFLVNILLFTILPFIFFLLSYLLSIAKAMCYQTLVYYWKFKKQSIIPTRKDFFFFFDLVSILTQFNIISIHKNIIYEGLHYRYFKPIAQDIIDEESNPVKNACTINTIFLSTLFVYFVYNIYEFTGIFLGFLLGLITIYWSFNLICIFWLFRKREIIKQILISIKHEDELFEILSQEIITSVENTEVCNH